MDFDKLGLTDNQNPLGVLPPVFARHMGRAAGSLLNEYIKGYLRRQTKQRVKRAESQNEFFHMSAETTASHDDIDMKLPQNHQHVFHGGERALLYVYVEEFLSTFGMNGKACLLRAICEVHSKRLNHFGLVGEIMKLFLR